MAKIVTREVHVSYDGKEHKSAADCAAHEAASPLAKLEGLTLAQIHSAVTYEDKDLAAALENAGTAARRSRIEAGDLRARGGQPKAA